MVGPKCNSLAKRSHHTLTSTMTLLQCLGCMDHRSRDHQGELTCLTLMRMSSPASDWYTLAPCCDLNMRLTHEKSYTTRVGRELLYVTDLGGPVATVQVIDVNTGMRPCTPYLLVTAIWCTSAEA